MAGEMSPRFYHYLKIVAAVHVVIAVVAIAISGWRGCFRNKEVVPLPIEFVVEAPRAAETVRWKGVLINTAFHRG